MSNLIKLTESFTDWNISEDAVKPIPIKLTEANKKTKIEGKEFDILGGYKIPIWRLDEKNKNGRLYEEKLADKVIKENKVTPVLDGHPSDNYVPKLEDIIAVGKNPTKEKVGNSKIMFAEVYFVKKDLHENIKRALELGLQLEQSSSGLGELKEDDITVNTESYVLERYCDLLVSDSSYAVSFDKTNEIKESMGSENEIEKDDKIITIYNIEEKTNKKDKIMDKSVQIPINLLRKNLEGYIEKAESHTDINKRLKAFTEISEWINESEKEALSDLSEKVESEIKVILEKKEELAIKGQKTDTLEKTLFEKDTILESYKNQLEETQEKLESCYEMLDNLKDYSNRYKEMFDVTSGKINTMVEAKDYVKAKKEVEDKEAEKEEAEKELEKVKEVYSKLKLKYNSFVESVKKDKLEESKRIASIKKRKEEKKLKQELAEAKRLERLEKLQLEERLKRDEELNYTQQLHEVRAYYSELCKKHGSRVMESFKDKILESRTLSDAQIKYFKIRYDIETLEESYNNTSSNLVERLNKNTESFKKSEPRHYLL